MNIEIHQPRLEALIHERMASGHFKSVEDLLLQTLESSPHDESTGAAPRQNFAEFLQASPLWESGLEIAERKDLPRRVEL